MKVTFLMNHKELRFMPQKSVEFMAIKIVSQEVGQILSGLYLGKNS